MRIALPHPTLGDTPGVRTPIRFSESSSGAAAAPPPLGFRTHEILSNCLGLDHAVLDDLRAKGVIG